MSSPTGEEDIGEETKPTAALPIKRIFFTAIVLPVKHVAVIGRFALPLLVILLAGIFEPLLVPEELLFSVEWALISLLLILLFVVAGTLATVACHRVFILGPESMAGFGLVRWSMREWRFIGWMLVIMIRALPIVIAVSLVYVPILFSVTEGFEEPTPIGLVALGYVLALPVAYVISRASILLPATAIDERPSMKWAWSLSKGNGLRLMVIVGVLPMLTELLLEQIPVFDSLVYSILHLVIYLYVTAAEIAILSLSYRELVSDQRAELAG